MRAVLRIAWRPPPFRVVKICKEYRPALYDALLLSGKLNSHLAEIDQKANAMFSRLVEQMAQRQGVTEQLKISDQMTWVGRMNNIRKVVEEIVHGEFVLP